MSSSAFPIPRGRACCAKGAFTRYGFFHDREHGRADRPTSLRLINKPWHSSSPGAPSESTRRLPTIHVLFLARFFFRSPNFTFSASYRRPRQVSFQISAMDRQANPALLQKGDPSRAPLFLIHDAGGGIYSYYKLENIGRPVYTIYNPWFRNETKWEGGAMMFVEEYIKLIKKVVPKGDILVGGKKKK